jgi:hydrogenase maturation factor HypF (carbamoyltransferase family)
MEECPQLPIPCPYHTYGCQITVIRTMLKEHLFDHYYSHLELVCKTIEQKDMLWKQKLGSVQYDGPFRISSHSHIVVLYEDMKDAVCNECKKPIEEENQKWFAYYCTSGCTYCVCTECFPSLRVHKSRKHPNELLFSFS